MLVSRDSKPVQRPRPGKEPPPATNFAGVLGYWSFDEGQGSEAKDGSEHGQHGTVHGSRWIRGIRGQALQFVTKEDYFDYGPSPHFNFLARAPFSFVGWLQTTAARGTVLSQRNRADGGAVIDLGLASGRLNATVREDGGESGQPATLTGPPVNDGAWHHFVLLRRTGGNLELYVDGRLGGSGSGAHAGGAITTNLRSVAREQFWVAVRGGPGESSWRGCIDEFAIFNRALADEEIKRLSGQDP